MTDSTDESQTPSPKLRFRKVASARDVRRYVLRVVNAVLAGEISAKAANAAIYGFAQIQRSLDSDMLERRLAALEERAGLSLTPASRGVGNGARH